MEAVVLACAAQVVYIAAFALFKLSARAMRPLSGRHPLNVVVQAASSPRWLIAWWVLMGGFALAGTALITLPLAAALPACGFSLLLLLAVGMRGFGERPTSREWLAAGLTVAAMLIAALSVLAMPGQTLAAAPRRTGALTPPDALAMWRIALVVVPSLLIPLWMFTARDRAVAGRHARPVTGIAYGIGAGVLLGTCEAFGLGLVLLIHGDHRLDVFGTVHPYLFLLSGAFGLGLLSIGLQRCRLTIIVTVVTVTAKVHLLLAATLLYGEPWPSDPPSFLLRVGAVLLAVLAIMAFPRHERSRQPGRPALALPAPAQRPAAPAPAQPMLSAPSAQDAWAAQDAWDARRHAPAHTPPTGTPASHTPASHTPASHTPASQTPPAHTPPAHTPAARTSPERTSAGPTPASRTPAAHTSAGPAPAAPAPPTRTPAAPAGPAPAPAGVRRPLPAREASGGEEVPVSRTPPRYHNGSGAHRNGPHQPAGQGHPGWSSGLGGDQR